MVRTPETLRHPPPSEKISLLGWLKAVLAPCGHSHGSTHITRGVFWGSFLPAGTITNVPTVVVLPVRKSSDARDVSHPAAHHRTQTMPDGCSECSRGAFLGRCEIRPLPDDVELKVGRKQRHIES